MCIEDTMRKRKQGGLLAHPRMPSYALLKGSITDADMLSNGSISPSASFSLTITRESA